MTAPPLDDLDQRLRARFAELRRSEIEEVGERPLAWLAVAPVWTQGLAASAGFPTGRASLDEFLERAERLGLAARGRDAGAGQSRERVPALLRLAPFLSEQQIELTLDRIAEITDPGSRSRALVQLTPHLPDGALARAVGVAREFPSPADRAGALAALSERLPSPGKETIVAEALTATDGLPDHMIQAQVLLHVWPVLTDNERAARAAYLIGKLSTSASTGARSLMQAVVPLMPPELLGTLAAALQSNEDPAVRTAGFSVLAPELPEPQRSSLLGAADEAARALTDPILRSAALSDVAYALTRTGLFGNALEVVNAIEDEQVRNYALGLVADGLAHAGRHEQAREVTEHLLDATARTDPALGVSLGSGVLRRLADAAAAVETETIAARLIDAALHLRSDAATIPALAEAAEALRPRNGAAAQQLLDKAVDAAHAIPDEADRSEALMGLAARLSGPLREELLAEAASAIRSLAEPRQRLRKLVTLAPLLRASDRERVVEEVLQLLEPANADRSFWMPEARRSAVLDGLRETRDPDWLAETAADVAARVYAVLGPMPRPRRYRTRGRPGGLAPSGMARWARLGALLASNKPAGHGTAAAARELDRLVGDLCNAGDTAAAMAWTETGSLLAQSVGGELEGAALLAAGRVERQHRQVQDRRRLRDFLPRDEQLKQFLDLLSPSSAAWALHYVGMPGVGKTMLIRHITAEVAAAQQIATARLDFDRLNPRFPLTRPGQLLVAFAQDLQPYLTDPRQQDQLRELKARVVQLHETIGHSYAPIDPRATISSKEFRGALDAFNDLLRMLQRPVVLILDTCEELARLRPVGIQLPAIDTTFTILERIHEAVQSVRVVFAGRRLLASDGADWPPGIGATIALPPRPYLQLHEIRGFTADEADRYLSRAIGPRLTPALRDAMLAGSPETGRALQPRMSLSEPIRYSPFDLALYADWARAVPTLSPADIASEHSDQYIEVRIISRLAQSDVPLVLPAVALLGRFDATLLRLAFDGGDAAFADLWVELADLEWVDYQPDETLGRAFLEVQPRLLPRLRRYYTQYNMTALSAARQRLAAGLTQLIDDQPLDLLPVDHLDAAMRLLPPDEGARLWSRLEPRIAEAGRWDWARGVTERLLAEGGAVSDAAHPGRAAVEATLCAALRHGQRELDVGELWRDVLAHVDNHPDPSQRTILRHRAVLGQIVAECLQSDAYSPVLAADIATSLEPPDAGSRELPEVEQLAAAGCAALDALLDRLDTGRPAPLPDPSPITEWAVHLLQVGVCDEVASFAWMLAARVLAKAGNPSATEAVHVALEHVPEHVPQAQPQVWSDWPAPTSIRDRVRLEALRLDPVSAAERAERDAWRQEAIGHVDLIDAERLVAAALLLELDAAPVTADRLTALTNADRYLPERQATCAAHRATPPLFAVLAEGWSALPGGCDQALAMLDRRSAAATGTGRDLSTIQAAQQEKLQVMRRMRLAAVDSGLVAQLVYSANKDAIAKALPLIALTERPDSPALPERLQPELAHAWWRSRPTPSPAAAVQAVAIFTEQTSSGPPEHLAGDVRLVLRGRAYQIPPSPTSDQLSLALDWEEAALLSHANVDVRELEEVCQRWFDTHPDAADDHVRLLLRTWAQGTIAGPLPDDTGTLEGYAPLEDRGQPPLNRHIAVLGKRRVAGLAMDEGELLALRLPRRAVPLLRLASQLYRDAGDTLGELCALVCAASAAGRAPARWPGSQVDTAWKVLDDLHRTYERFASASQFADADRTALPSWEELRGGSKSLDDLVTDLAPWLNGWAERLVLTVDFLRRGRRAPERRPTLEALRHLAVRYSDGPPTELAFGPPRDERPVRPLRRRKWWRRILPWAVPIAVFAVGVALSVIGSQGSQNGATLFAGGLLDLFGIGAITGVLLLRSGRLLGRIVRGFLAARTDVQIKIVPVRADFGVTDLADIHALLHIRAQSPVLAIGWPLLRDGERVIAEGVFRGSAAGPFDAAAKAVPPEIAGRLAKLADRLRRRHVMVGLDVDYSLSEVPWEALLAVAVSQLGRSPRALRFARTTRLLTAAPVRQTRLGALFVCPREWLPLVHAVWGKPAIADESDGDHAAAVSLIHLMGAPVQTSAGRRVSVAGVEQGAAHVMPVEVAVRAADLVDPAQLPVSDQTLAVVQHEPIATRPMQVTTDRERSAALRAYAADVFLAGAGAVLFMPALEPSAVPWALAPLARRSRRPMDADQLLGVLQEVRERIAIADPGSASEVTVFVGKGRFGGLLRERDRRREETHGVV